MPSVSAGFTNSGEGRLAAAGDGDEMVLGAAEDAGHDVGLGAGPD